MKNLYNCVFGFMICVILSACSAKLPITKWTHSGQMSGAIWYTQKNTLATQTAAPTTQTATPAMQTAATSVKNATPNDTPVMSIPLLVHAEWEDTPTQKGTLALVFLHGSLLAKCQYDDTELVCETKSSFLGVKSMVYDCAMLVSASINTLQGMPVNVQSQWDFKDVSRASEQSDNNVSNVTTHIMSDTDNNISSRTFSLENKKTKITLKIKEATWR